MNIFKYPHPFLAEPTIEVKFPLTKESNNIIDNMIKNMYEANGIGLAANQLGYVQRIFVMDVSNKRDKPQVFINPVIEKRAKEKLTGYVDTLNLHIMNKGGNTFVGCICR